MNENRPLWRPSAKRIAAANLTAFMRSASARWGAEFDGYTALHRWSAIRWIAVMMPVRWRPPAQCT